MMKKKFTTESKPEEEDVSVKGVRLCNAYFVPEVSSCLPSIV